MAEKYKFPKATKRESRTGARTLTSQLPGDSIIGILLRVPVKKLIKFKSVCKLWGQIISHPSFTRLHMKQFENGSKRILLSTKPLQAIDFEAYINGDGKGKVELVYPKAMKKAPEFGIKLVGSCNGLICLFIDNHEFILWNPSTRESRELQKPPSYAPDSFRLSFGFGFDDCSDYYKVILLALPRVDDDNNASNATGAEVHILKSNSWRRIQGLQSGLQLDGYGIFLHEKLHWLGRMAIAANRRSYVIVSFNLAIEKFQKPVPLPNYVERTASNAILGVSENSLCLFCNSGRRFYEGWIMKKIYKSSWSRVFSVGIDHLPNFRSWRREICYTKTGQVLINYDGMELVIYDPKDGTSQFLAGMDWSCRFHSILYIESLVSPVIVKL